MHISLDSALGRQRRLNSVGESVFQIAPNPSAGYSLRSLTGGDPAVVRVRRASDNSEKDFNSSGVSSGELVNWVNGQVVPPLDVRELVDGERTGALIPAAAAYSLRNLSASYTGDVVEVRRNTDGATLDFSAAEVADGTLTNWVNTSFANALPLDTASGAAAAYSLRNLSASYTGNVVDVRRSSDDAEDSFTAAEVADGTLTDWVNEDVNLYTSDFSVDADGLTSSNGTLAGNIDGIDGVDDTLRFALSGGDTSHTVNVSNAGPGLSYTLSFDYYIPSANTALDGIEVQVTSSSYTSGILNVTDTWTTVNLTLTPDATGTLRFRTLDGGSATPDGDGDVVYFKNIVFTQTTADGFVTQWYDQSGNANHATQGTDASQPKIVDAGNFLNKLLFEGSQLFDTITLSDSAQPNSIFTVSNTNVASQTRGIYGTSASQAGYYRSSNIHAIFSTGTAAAAVLGSAYVTDRDYLRFDLFNGASSVVGVDGNTTSGTTGDDKLDRLDIGDSTLNGVNPLNGGIKELILYPSDQSDKRQAIEENIGSNYGITLTSSKDGTVSTWYDQSGNANHATQTDAASQPKIVDAGSLVSGGLDFDGVDDHLDSIPNLFSGTSAASSFVVGNADTTAASEAMFSQGSNNIVGNAFVITSEIAFRPGGNTIYNDDFVNANPLLLSTIAPASSTSADVSMFLDGSTLGQISTTSAVLDYSTEEAAIGQNFATSASYDGRLSEIIIYNSDQSDNRTAFEANIGETYGIDLPSGVDTGYDQVDGFVETWYDQSGNGNDAVQATASNQPKIVDAGVLVTDRDGKIALNGKSASLDMPSNAPMLSSDGTYSLFAAVDLPDQTLGSDTFNDIIRFESSGSGGASANRKPLWSIARSSGQLNCSTPSFGGAGGSISATFTETKEAQLLTNICNPALSTGNNLLYNSGSLIDSSDTATEVNTQTLTSSSARLFDLQETTVETFLSEVIYYPSDQSANRAAIETNIKNQYDIY